MRGMIQRWVLTWKQAQDKKQWLRLDYNSVAEWSCRNLAIAEQREGLSICSSEDLYRSFSYPTGPRNNRRRASIDSLSILGKGCCRWSRLENSTVGSAYNYGSIFTELARSIVQNWVGYRWSITFENVIRSLFTTELCTGVPTRIIVIVTRETFSMIFIIEIVPSECPTKCIEPIAT